MALQDGNGKYSSAVRMIEAEGLSSLVGDLIYLLEDRDLQAELPPADAVPTVYNRYFSDSRLIRIRDGSISASIRGSQPSFFSFYKEDAVLESVRLATAFFGKGQFASDDIRVEGQQFCLRQYLEGPYFQPLDSEDINSSGLWVSNDSGLRRQSEIQKLESQVQVNRVGKEFVLEFEIKGTAHVPLAIEMGFRKGGKLSGVDPIEGTEGAFFLNHEGQFGEYLTAAGNRISFGPGFHQHNWTQLRGALPKLDALCVYLTGFTPFLFRLTVR
jgi:hypothetical protein